MPEKPLIAPFAQIEFDPSVWFSSIISNDLDNANLDSNGVIVISESKNASLFDYIADKLDQATQGIFQ